MARFGHPLKPSKPSQQLSKALERQNPLQQVLKASRLLCHGTPLGCTSCFYWASKLGPTSCFLKTLKTFAAAFESLRTSKPSAAAFEGVPSALPWHLGPTSCFYWASKLLYVARGYEWNIDCSLMNICIIYIYYLIHWSQYNTSSTAQGGGRSFKNRKPIGEVGCCESRMAERSHWWTERCLKSPLFFSLSLSFSLCFSIFLWLSTYLPTELSVYLSICLSIYLSTYLPTYLSSCLVF